MIRFSEILLTAALLGLIGAAVYWAVRDEARIDAGLGHLPQHVAGPLSGFAYDCEQSRQPFDARAFVSSADLDGDGRPDYIFDVAKGCDANRQLYCTAAEGCNVHVFLSSRTLGRDTIRARTVTIGTSGGAPALLLELGKVAACNGADHCRRAWVWTGAQARLVE